MHSQYVIVDDFYPDPDSINALAQRLPREEKSAGNYSGSMTLESFFTEQHKSIFKDVTGMDLNPSTGLTGKFRFSPEGSKAKQHIHFDVGRLNNCQWAGVVYLQKEPADATESDLEKHGTSFWRHKRTGLTSIPLTQEGIEKYGWHNTDDLKFFLETEGLDESRWDKILTVPYKYNRLAIFKPWMFHSPGKPFGTDDTNCRLIQTFFLGI